MAICKKRAFEVLEKISFERIAGTEQELKCANIIKEECEKLGIEAIIEDFEIEMPEVYEASLEVTAPTQYKVHCIGVGKSGNTDENGVSGPLCYIENALDANLLDVKGKIVLITGMVKPDQMKKIYDAGAIGYILVGGSLYDPEEMIPEIIRRIKNKNWECDVTESDITNLLNYYEEKEITCELRWLGIIMACYDKDNFALKYPIKITAREMEYKNASPSKRDPNQGWES